MADGPSDVLPAPRRGVVLPTIALICVAFFVLTYFVSAAYHRERTALARHWLQTGDADFAAGRAANAVDAYRAALTYDPVNPQTTLKLAEALARAGQARQASSYLLSLLQEEPGNGPVNMALARLSVRQQNAADAMRYYHGAIYGGWSGQGERMRREARLELIDFLLTRNDITDARSELIGLTGDLPRDAAVVASVADRFTRAGDNANALRLYRDAISLHGTTPAVLSGAGMAAFQLGDYRAAEQYLQRAHDAGVDDVVSRTLETSRAVLELDPFSGRLSTERRIERLRRVLAVAEARVSACKPVVPASAIAPGAAQMLQQLEMEQQIALARRQLDRARELDPDVVDGLMKLVIRAEEQAAACPTSPQDDAVSLIARAREAVQP